MRNRSAKQNVLMAGLRFRRRFPNDFIGEKNQRQLNSFVSCSSYALEMRDREQNEDEKRTIAPKQLIFPPKLG